MQRMQIYYPAVFHPEEDGGYSVVVPDMEQLNCGCFTQGDTFEEACKMAFDAIGLALDGVKPENYPVPSKPETLEHENCDLIVPIMYDSYQYAKNVSKKSVHKSITIPGWLNDLAEENHINYSKLLREAIANQLGVTL